MSDPNSQFESNTNHPHNPANPREESAVIPDGFGIDTEANRSPDKRHTAPIRDPFADRQATQTALAESGKGAQDSLMLLDASERVSPHELAADIWEREFGTKEPTVSLNEVDAIFENWEAANPEIKMEFSQFLTEVYGIKINIENQDWYGMFISIVNHTKTNIYHLKKHILSQIPDPSMPDTLEEIADPSQAYWQKELQRVNRDKLIMDNVTSDSLTRSIQENFVRYLGAEENEEVVYDLRGFPVRFTAVEKQKIVDQDTLFAEKQRQHDRLEREKYSSDALEAGSRDETISIKLQRQDIRKVELWLDILKNVEKLSLIIRDNNVIGLAVKSGSKEALLAPYQMQSFFGFNIDSGPDGTFRLSISANGNGTARLNLGKTDQEIITNLQKLSIAGKQLAPRKGETSIVGVKRL